MSEQKFKAGDKVRWNKSGRTQPGSGTVRSYQTTGEGRGRSTRVLIDRDGGGELRLFEKTLVAA